MTCPTILLADDHKMMLEGLRGLLEPEFTVVGAVEDGRNLVLEAKRLRPDLVVADISMPALNGIDAAREIKKFDARIRIVFLTMHADPGYAASAFEAGASGFVLKHSAPQELITALRHAMQGHTFVLPILTGEQAGLSQQGKCRQKDLRVALNPRQKEVLRLLASGKSAKEIASILNISCKTVEFHKYRMLEQLRIKTSAELIQYAIREGIITL